MATYVYPNSYELRAIEQVLIPRLTQDRPAFDLLPMMNRDRWVLQYEQMDNFRGLQQVRGMDGDPFSVPEPAVGVKYVEPGVYGEFRNIKERDLTERRAFGGQYGEPIRIDELVTAAQNLLLERELDRMEKLIWDTLVLGTFTALGKEGQVLHTDSYSIQTYPVGVPWATVTTSSPLADLRGVKLLARGTSADFGSRSRLYMNQGTANSMFANLNQNDLGSKRAAGLSSITGINDFNQIFMKEDLPTVVIYDRGYYDTSGVFQLFIPNNRAVLVGVRQSGVSIGEYQLVRNANNPDSAPGAYTKIVDNLERDVPRKIQVHRGHNGGPVLFFPGAVVSMIV